MKLLAVFIAAAAAFSAPRSQTRSSPAPRSVLALRGGGGEPSEAMLQATFACNRLYASCLAEANAEVAMLRKTVAAGEDLSGFGAKADAVLADAEDKFSAGTPAGDADVAQLYADKKEELSEAVLTSIEPAFVKALAALKETALESFKAQAVGQDDLANAASAAEAAFVKGAKVCVPAKAGWGYKAERASLVAVIDAIKSQSKKASAVKQQAQQQMSTAMNYLQLQSQQMQQIQAQYAGGQGGKWSLGAAYRPPDTNINLSGSYQQGRGNLQLWMVPDEGAALLGPNGFTNGVGPANLGLSMNVHL
ncbi:hypothetical protein EMIHUDRAFT_464972 [Emiliania huxleyi CCMP1516]|uniref:Uncharacterized protein n=2 Tax=Emiliania huxleyi TaxID=2903 RepID=A0A0D3IKW8_EMIH1|nr:hypothetical protein EMIHUDRAFT_464972 [Emiliania huxleyi CCMP1516]EOD11903.1 hypothetical protein EMIHUDRAFT_464972 [Emiliania huxleyi CCMP1516]|eukprot:XP_005764332.1 hypothetical protein EMIHUDRAFT_464972 [Emiliania huxleyi CCMP1516]